MCVTVKLFKLWPDYTLDNPIHYTSTAIGCIRKVKMETTKEALFLSYQNPLLSLITREVYQSRIIMNALALRVGLSDKFKRKLTK